MIYDEKIKQPQTKDALKSELKRIEHGIALRKAVIADLESRRRVIQASLKDDD